jgi:putative endonuclease
MHYVHILKSMHYSACSYVGYTTNFRDRIARHNSGDCATTADLRPLKLVAYVAFEDMIKAKQFEYYLKSHSGRAFISKRLM